MTDAKAVTARAVWPVLGSALLLGAAAVRRYFKGPIQTQPIIIKAANAAKPAGAAAAGGGAGADAKAQAAGDKKKAAAADIRIVPMRAEHIEAAGKVCEEAFNGFAEHMHAPVEFPPGLAATIFTAGVAAMAKGSAYLVVAIDAADGNRVVGSNMIDIADGIGGVGPISVDPNAGRQLGGVGRALMQAVIDWCIQEKGIKDIRLCAICDNKVSWSLYTKMGFVSPFHSADFGGITTSKLLTMPITPGLKVRDMTNADIAACDALVKRITPDHLKGRAQGIADAAHSSWARLVAVDEKTGAIVGFTTGFRIDGFTYATTQHAVQSLLCEYARRIAKLNPNYELVFHVPLRLYPDLARWCLVEGGLKLARQIAMMQLDLTQHGGPAWADPKVDQGIYLHNISY